VPLPDAQADHLFLVPGGLAPKYANPSIVGLTGHKVK
jgi:hypothetical protein